MVGDDTVTLFSSCLRKFNFTQPVGFRGVAATLTALGASPRLPRASADGVPCLYQRAADNLGSGDGEPRVAWKRGVGTGL